MRILLAILASLLLALPVRAQDAPPAPTPGGEELVDRVVAVVGDTSLLLSDVHEEIDRLRAAGQPLPSDPQGQAELFRDVLQNQVDQLVLLQAAKRAGLEVTDRDVAPVVEQEIAQIRQRFGSEAALDAALAQSGLTLDEYRRMRMEQNRAQAMVQRYVRQRVESAVPPVVGEEEIRRVFEARRAELGQRPATVSFRQVLIRPTASDSAKAAARRRAEEVLAEIRAGGDFEVLARRYSDDPGSKERGGDLGWFRQGTMVRPFEAMAFALRPGDVSPVVETQFGFHVIKVEKVRGGERQARHILIRPEITDADRARAREQAEAAAAAARAGTPLSELQARYETPADQRAAEDVPLERLPPAYGPALQEAAVGAVVGPFELAGAGASGGDWAVLRLTERREAGEYTLEDVRERVQRLIQEQKVMEQVVDELRDRTYVNVLI